MAFLISYSCCIFILLLYFVVSCVSRLLVAKFPVYLFVCSMLKLNYAFAVSLFDCMALAQLFLLSDQIC